MSDTLLDVFSMTGTSWTLVSKETSTQITLRESGQNSLGQAMQVEIEDSQIKISTENFPTETWPKEVVISATTWGLHGLLREALRSLSRSWRSSKPGTVEETLSAASFRPSPASRDGGNGQPNNSRLSDALRHLLDGGDISLADQEMIRLYAKLLLSCLSPPPPTE
jgi:hypothetical protein